MKTRSLILVVGAVTLSVAVALVARALMRPPPPVTIVKEVPVERAPQRRVLVAARSLSAGQFLEAGSLVWLDKPADVLGVGHFTATGDAEQLQIERQLLGAALRVPLEEHQPVARDMTVRAGEPGFLAAVLTPGMRAVSIPTNAVASNAGLVSAGDWVDVILVLGRDAVGAAAEPAAAGAAPDQPLRRMASQTVLRRVRVLALNSSTAGLALAAAPEPDDAASRAAGRASRSAAAGAGRATYESLTLEVTPAAAERLALLRDVGVLQIALRGVADHEDADADPMPRPVTRMVDATDVLGSARQGAAPVVVKTYQGAQQGSLTFGGTP